MILNMTLSWLSGISSEAVGDIGDDLELIFHGKVKFSGDLFLSPDLCSPRPGIKLMLRGSCTALGSSLVRQLRLLSLSSMSELPGR